jgi:hypothetical protein
MGPFLRELMTVAGEVCFAATLQLSHARRADKPWLWNNWAMLSVSIVAELQKIKGVARWRLVRQRGSQATRV